MRSPRWPLGVVAVLVSLLAPAPARIPTATAGLTATFPSTPEGDVRGLALGLYYPEERARADSSLVEIAALGATHVSIPVPLEQRSIRSPGLRDSSAAPPSDSLLAHVAGAAHALGLRVVLFPLLHLSESGRGKWRGVLAPPDWHAWFDSYGDRIVHYARLAEASHVEWLCVGAELGSSEGQVREWRRLLRRVRAVYSGRLLYSQNWDVPGRLAFADALDRVGFNAYFELSPAASPSSRELTRRWREIAPRLVARARGYGHGLLLTEIGYPSSECAAARPWDYVAPRSYRPDLQAACFRAFFSAWSRRSGFEGGFVYLWSGRSAAGDRGYSIRGKPAAEVVRSWYRGGFPSSARGWLSQNGMRVPHAVPSLEGAATGPDPRY